MILLTDEEIWELNLNKIAPNVSKTLTVAKAHLKKVAEWGEDGCPHKLFDGFSLQFKHECPAFWQALSKECE